MYLYITSMDKKHWEEFVIRLSNVWWFPEGEHQEQLDQCCGPGQDNITPSPENTKFSKLSCKLDSDKWFTEIKVDTLPLLIPNVPSLTVNLDPNIEATPTFDDAESWWKYTAKGLHFIKTSIYVIALLPATQMMKDNQGLILIHASSLYSVSCCKINYLASLLAARGCVGSYWACEGILLILTLPATHPMHSTHLQGFPSELSFICPA